jgi:hypothetical protein
MAGSVEFPRADDWYDDPKMMNPMENPSELWLKRNHKYDLAFRPLETALEQGVVDALSQSPPAPAPVSSPEPCKRVSHALCSLRYAISLT